MVLTSLAGRVRASLLGDWHRARPARRFGYLNRHRFANPSGLVRPGWSGA